MRILLLLISLFVLVNVSAQDSLVVKVNVVDEQFQEPIQRVAITAVFAEGQSFRMTGSKGEALFQVRKGEMITFKLSHEKYFVKSNQIKRISEKERMDTVEFTFEMEIEAIKTQDLNEITIAAPGVPVEVFGSKRLHVEDFEVLPNGDMVLLTYPKRLKKGSELLLYDGVSKVKQSFQVPGTAQELVRDYRGNPHVICEDNVFGIHVGHGTIGISSLEKEYFTKYLAPIVDTNQAKMYFSTFNPDYPAFEYFAYDQLDSVYSKITGITDDLMMELYRSEYKWADIRTKLWAKNLEIQTGVDAEIYVGANYFTNSIYYKELYAPLFHRNDSLFVFDYYKDRLYTYDAEGNPIDSVGIYHHYQPRRTGWKKELIQDRETGQIYALFDRAGYTYLGWVDTKTGEITQQVKLEYRYVNKVAVHNNFVYYTYRPFESIQKKYLYKERLPYKFGPGSVPEGDNLTEE